MTHKGGALVAQWSQTQTLCKILGMNPAKDLYHRSFPSLFPHIAP